jgi:Ca2+-binding RTX toxin-like protein
MFLNGGNDTATGGAGDDKIFGSIRISYAHGLTGRIPAAAARTARGVGCLGSTAR